MYIMVLRNSYYLVHIERGGGHEKILLVNRFGVEFVNLLPARLCIDRYQAISGRRFILEAKCLVSKRLIIIQR